MYRQRYFCSITWILSKLIVTNFFATVHDIKKDAADLSHDAGMDGLDADLLGVEVEPVHEALC